MKRWAILVVVAAQIILAVGLPARQAAAVGGVTFTLTGSSAYLRSAPSSTAAPTYSIFKGQRFAVTGRNADSTWITLDYAGATKGTWVRASFGTIEGQLTNIPVSSGSVVVPTTTPPASGATPAPSANTAAGTLLLTIVVNNVPARDMPVADGAPMATLFLGQEYLATGRDSSGTWVRIKMWGDWAWVPAGSVRLAGRLTDLPIVDASPPAAGDQGNPALKPGGPLPAWIPVINSAQRDIYYRAPAFGRSHRMFTVVGDCNSLSYYYLELVAKNIIDLRGQDYLKATIQNFKPSFFRLSAAVSGGFNSASILDPIWADPRLCQSGESSFACELRVSQASIVFIALGTGDQRSWSEFENNYRTMLSYALANGVLPVVVTKADKLESEEGGAEPGYINNVIRRLAQEYNVPLLDFEMATRELPNHGLEEEPGNDFHLSGAGMGVHVMTTLETLNAIWQP